MGIRYEIPSDLVTMTPSLLPSLPRTLFGENSEQLVEANVSLYVVLTYGKSRVRAASMVPV